ncbi:pyrimidine dimer DNA glycosylase/endonuclease V [Sideroxydans lithotrophicus]|uniref:DNA-(Apurinic or apyrimidinic site) lyase / pyrimidine dimer DNA glycosylase n=1 Tax=Sideroxydans lithotrophicus (strain ES-1) TaxID=580332 RepID=D5CLI9_SIDLE|nr:pyrimidine dimer DNA glycosylase/endonuclease V [Sideroxydans lithotrophicus]ADE10577.1 DNA-(apurinic or apyrimidinic site) lyase / pyrimidine dimer DNA glycosylase [Sideroxydans lithotrophicus ES-1]
MRIWSVHPRYLDAKGLVALWREALLAQKVLSGETRGYRHHPQLKRFRKHEQPLEAIAAYLHEVQREAERRGYNFDATKILRQGTAVRIPVTDGQIAYELSHLRAKLEVRDRAALERLPNGEPPSIHPLFKVISGDVEDWEVV